MKNSLIILILFFISCLPQTKSREHISEMTGKVTYVSDGDTFHFVSDSAKYKIRLADIDAPEIRQAYGLEAKEFLMSLIKDKTITIHIVETDRYDRQVAYIYLDGQDINLTMVQNGFAWWYEKYGPGNTTYQEAQNKAEKKKMGLWKQEDAMEPWVWRKAN